MLKYSWFLVFGLVLSGCVSHLYNEDSEFTRIPAGSSLKLNQSIHIAANRLAVFMQDGNIEPYSAINKYYPYCKFELYTLSDHARTVQPDNFSIVKVADETDMSSLRQPMYAGLQISGVYADDGPDIVTFTTYLYLRSKSQKDVYRISCMQWALVNEGRYLTIAEMRKAMGGLFTLTVSRRDRITN